MRLALLCVLAALLTGCLNLGASAGVGISSLDLRRIDLGVRSEVEVSDGYSDPVRPTSSLAVVVGGATVGDGTFRDLEVPLEEQAARFLPTFLAQLPDAFEPVEIGVAGPGVRGFLAQQIGMPLDPPADGARLEFPEFVASYVLLIPQLEVYHFLPGEDLPLWFVALHGRETTGTRLEAPFTLWDNMEGAVVARGRIEVAELPTDLYALVRGFALEVDRRTPIGVR